MKKEERKIEKKVEKKESKKVGNNSKTHGDARVAGSKLLSKGSGYMGALETRSPYLRTILDPSNCLGVKIPDSVTTPSFPVHGHHIDATIVPVVGTGTSAGNYWFAVAVQVGSLNQNASSFQADISFLTAVASGAITWGGPIVKQYASTVVASAAMARPVSLLACLKYLGNPLNATGRMGVSYYPGGLINSLPTTVGALTQAPYFDTTEAAKTLYVEGRYVPADPIAVSYNGCSGFPYRPNGNVLQAAQYGTLILWGFGLPSAQAVEYEIFENLECIPGNATASINAVSPSWSDPIEMAGVSNAIAEMPEVAVAQNLQHVADGSTDVISGNGAKVVNNKSNEGPGFLDTLLDFGLKALPGIGMGLLSMFG